MKFRLDLNEIHMLLQATENNVKHDNGCRHIILQVEGDKLRLYQPCAYAECFPTTLKTLSPYNPE